MIKNEEYEVKIIDNGMNGEGICKIDGITIFVPNSIKDEKCLIKIVKVNKNFCFGKLLKVIEKSPNRVEPDCTSFNRCGGCDLRHISYPYTLQMKQEKVQNLLNKALINNIKVEETLGMDEPYYYRNKAIFPVSIKDGKPFIGIYAERSHEVIPFEECKIQNLEAQKIAKYIVNNWKETIYDEETHKGLLRNIMIRTGFSTKEVMVVLVLNDEYEFDYNNLIKEFPMIKTIVLNINNKNTNVVLSNINKVIYGEGFITDILGDYKFIISPNSFYQVNPIQTLAIYNKAIELANLKDNETIVDLYCGIGTIGIFASKYVQKVYGIEIVPEAILNAKENAKSNNINNIEFILGDVEKAFDEFISNKQEKIDTIFLDPPRKGCDNKTIENIIKIKPEKVVYISCNPATLARDLHMLENDYDIKVVQPIDNFPYTSHVETIAILK